MHLGVKRGYRIRNIVRLSNGTYDLYFDIKQQTNQWSNDNKHTRELLMIFPQISSGTIQQKIRIFRGISKLKMRAIQEIRFGAIAKMNINFQTRFWNAEVNQGKELLGY